MNKKKYVSAFLYSCEIPTSVWSGIELDRGNYKLGAILILVIMALVFFGVDTFIDAQTQEIKKSNEVSTHK